MRHKVYGRHLGRDKNARVALFKNLVRSLILEEEITTSVPKAKAVKGLVDKIINQAKTPTTRKLVSQFLTDQKALDKLIKEIAPKLSDRKSGYTSLVRVGQRLGDGTTLVKMSFVEGKKVTQKEEKTETKIAPKAIRKTRKVKINVD